MPASPTCLSKLLVLIAFALAGSNAISAPEATEITTTARVTVRGSEVREFDWAKSRARARIAYTSSGPRTLRGRMIDNDLQTSFRFSESDQSPTVIVELAKSTELHRVSAVFKAEDAELGVYLLNELPKDPSDLGFAKPSASAVSLPDEHGMATVNVSVSSARYVVLRWKRKRSDDPFTVAEISAFSNAPADLTSDGDPHLADNTNSFAAPEPPLIPVVSP
jgi:hypothetical protein